MAEVLIFVLVPLAYLALLLLYLTLVPAIALLRGIAWSANCCGATAGCSTACCAGAPPSS